MRTLFLLLCLANIAVAVGMNWWMPDPMGTHFGAGNQADGFMSPAGFAVFISGFVALFATGVLIVPWLVRVLPASGWRMPNREFWMSEENRPRTARRFRSFFESVGIALMLLFLLIQWLTFHANRTAPPQINMPIFWCGFVGFLAVFAMLMVRFYVSFRLPKKTDAEIQ